MNQISSPVHPSPLGSWRLNVRADFWGVFAIFLGQLQLRRASYLMNIRTVVLVILSTLYCGADALGTPLWCNNRQSVSGEWETRFCICSCPGGESTPEQSFITDAENCSAPCEKTCPCPDDDQSWEGCRGGLCGMAQGQFLASGSPQPPPCEKGCYDYGVEQKTEESRFNLTCAVYNERKCSKYPPKPLPKPVTKPVVNPPVKTTPTAAPTTQPRGGRSGR